MVYQKESKAQKEEMGEDKSVKKFMKNKSKATKRNFREKSDTSDSDDSEVEIKKNKYERTRLAHVLEWDKQFWKLTKPRYGVHQILLCKECQDFNYKMGKSRFDLDGERLRVTQSLCDECVLLNIDLANRELHHADPHYPDNAFKESNKNQ